MMMDGWMDMQKIQIWWCICVRAGRFFCIAIFEFSTTKNVVAIVRIDAKNLRGSPLIFLSQKKLNRQKMFKG